MAWNGIYDHKYIIIEKGDKKLCLLISFLFFCGKNNNNLAVPAICESRDVTHIALNGYHHNTFLFKLFNI